MAIHIFSFACFLVAIIANSNLLLNVNVIQLINNVRLKTFKDG